MNAKGKILIIDDNEDVLFALNLLLDPYVEKIKVTTQPTRIEHFMTTFQPDVILLDMNFRRDAISGQEGFDCLEQILKLDPQAIVLFMTAYADTDKAVRAIKAGAIDFIPKPWEKEKLLATLSSAIKLRDSRKEVRQLKEQVVALSAQDEEMPQMIGHSVPMHLVARSLRYFSPRRECPFITIDLGSIPESLFESELFGYEKGAFTDARKAKAGRMEVASGGTLFLDEIGNLSLPMQAKLLTAIEKRQISRLGATDIIPIDVRLISATNVNIRELVEEGNFRQDLLYRINTIEITIPPLRERGEDVLLLADYFLQRYTHKYKKEINGLSREAKQKLMRYHWPGNVRELQHAIERAIILSDSPLLKPANFMLQPQPEKRVNTDEILNLEQLERNAIERAMKRSEGNLSRAAEYLGITRYALYRKLEKLGL